MDVWDQHAPAKRHITMLGTDTQTDIYMGVAKILERMVWYTSYDKGDIIIGSLLVCYYIRHKQMTIHTTEDQLH